MPYSITKSIDIDFGHIVQGHPGACTNPHGHTWKFEVTLESDDLNYLGFVADFGTLKREVLEPVHTLLDHSFALGHELYDATESAWGQIGVAAHGFRAPAFIGKRTRGIVGLCGAENRYPGDIKMVRFNFTPTSERLAKWLFEVAQSAFAGDTRIRVARARVFETLHPVEAVAEYHP